LALASAPAGAQIRPGSAERAKELNGQPPAPANAPAAAAAAQPGVPGVQAPRIIQHIVVRGTQRALVVADLPFGTYQASPQQALETAARFMKEGGAQAVKLEGGLRVVPQVEALVAAGVPVMAHIGLTPQSVNAFGGYRVQGRGDEASHRLLQDAKSLQHAGAFAVVLEVVPSEVAAQVTRALHVPTIGIGAGPSCDAQVLVWQDMAGLRSGGKPAKFVKEFANVAGVLHDAATRFGDEVRAGTYPAAEHEYH